MLKKLLGASAVVVLVLIGAGVWYFVIRDDSVEKDTVGCDPEPCSAAIDSIEGGWEIVPDESSTTLVITETIGGLADHQVEGNTEVDGSLEVIDDEVVGGMWTVDMTTLTFTDAPPGFDVANRARAMETTGLETEAFPQAAFALTVPIELEDDITSGEVVTVSATGGIVLHGVNKTITFDVDIVANGDRFEVTPSDFIPIVLDDYDISVQAPGFVADIADEGSLDFLLVFERA